MISYNFHIPLSETTKEVARFRASVEKCRKQLERMQSELRQSRIPESSFLVDAHLLILQDKLFVDRIIETIQERAVNTEWAIQQVSGELYEAYDRLQDDYRLRLDQDRSRGRRHVGLGDRLRLGGG